MQHACFEQLLGRLSDARTFAADLNASERDAIGVQLVDHALEAIETSDEHDATPLAEVVPLFVGPVTAAHLVARLSEEHLDPRVVDWCVDALSHHPARNLAMYYFVLLREAQTPDVVEIFKRKVRGFPQLLPNALKMCQHDVELPLLHRFLTYVLEDAMVHETRFPASDLIAARGEGTAVELLRKVVWATFRGREPVVVFQIDPEGFDFLDEQWRPVEVPHDAKVGVLHPSQFAAAQRDRWGEHLADAEIVAPFSQLDRGAGDVKFSYDLLDFEVNGDALKRFLLQRGWRLHPPTAFDTEQAVHYTRQIGGASLRLTACHIDDHRLQVVNVTFDTATAVAPRALEVSEALVATTQLLDAFAPARYG